MSTDNETLVQMIQSGDREAVLPLWKGVERYVQKRANRVANVLNGRCGVTEEDLVQCGFEAMMKAVNSYKPDRGAKFVTYLGFYLKTAFAEAAGYRTQAGEAFQRFASLDMPLSDEPDADTLREIIEDPAAAEDFEDAEQKIWNEQLRAAIEKALADLPDEESEAVRRHTMNGETLETIAQTSSVSEREIENREKRAIRKLRKPKYAKELAQYADERISPYGGTGFVSFEKHGRQPEYLAIKRERLMEARERQLIREEQKKKERKDGRK